MIVLSLVHELYIRISLTDTNGIELRHLHVDRCLKPAQFGYLTNVELHHFSDASSLGYGQCSYIRSTDDNGKVHVAFLMGKSRVAPLREVTIPRLELTAAVVSVRISTLLSRELEYENMTQIFWTDSKVVIGYINNDSKRFQVFVANRVSQIRERTEPSQGKYIESETNPADDASRGLTTKDLMTKSRWLKGPSFLWNENVVTQLQDVGDISVSTNDPELKKVKCHTLQTETASPAILDSEWLQRFSNWYRLKCVVAMCMKLKRKLRNKTNDDSDPCTDVTVMDLLRAECEVIKQVQQNSFGDEIRTLQKLKNNDSRELNSKSPLSKLDTFLDSDGILRVGGRIRNAFATCNEKHPIIMPKRHHVTKLVIRHCHEKTCHQGRGMTSNEIRSSGYWILGCSSAVSSYIFKCVKCRKLRSQVLQQKMADLPAQRVNEFPPFTYCGVDCLGPFLVKDGRKTLKRYGILFTCLACHAIHVEVASSLSTDSFLNALRRFQAIRGPVRELHCDRGTNFVGASNELKECLASDNVRDYLLKSNCDFVEFKMKRTTC